MTFTDQVTFDNLSLHAVVAPVPCRRITIRELASDTTPLAYNVAAPLSSNAVFPKYPAESVVFESRPNDPNDFFAQGTIVGYIQPVGGTVTFSRICE